MRLPDPIANTTTEAYLAYKAGVLAEGDLKPKLYEPYIHLDAWLAYWTGLTDTYPVKGVGKNLFDYAGHFHGGEYNGVEASLDRETGEITVSGKPTTSWQRVVKLYDITGLLEDGETYTLSQSSYDNKLYLQVNAYNTGAIPTYIYSYSRPTTFTVDKTAYPKYTVLVQIGDNGNWPSETTTITRTFQIEKGSTATAFEPYAGKPEMLCDEEAYIAYLSGVTDTYPEEFRDPADIRVAAYLRYLISARWGRPEYPVTNEELYLSMLKTKYIPSGDPSSDITINGTAKAPFVDVKMYGDTFQQTYTGKNLCNPATFVKGRLDNGVLGYASNTTSLTVEGNSITYTTNASYRGIVSAYIPVEPNTTYTLSRTVTSEITVSALIDVFESDSEASWITRLLTATFTTPSNCHYLRISFQNYASGTATISNIQVEKSSSTTSYEPYVGGVPSPNPDYPQPIQTVTGEQTVKVTGKNLFDKDSANITNYYPGTGEISYDSPYAVTIILPVVAGETYTASTTDRTKIAITPSLAFSDEIITSSGTAFLSVTQWTSASSVSATAPNGAKYMYLYIKWSQDATAISEAIASIQVELGSTATTYEPYSSNDYEINLGKNLLDNTLQATTTYSGTVTTIDGSTWTVVKPSNGGISLTPRTDFLPVNIKAGESVTFSSYPVFGVVTQASVHYQIRCYFYDKDENLLDNISTTTTANDIMAQVWSASYTPTVDVAYIKLGYYVPSNAGTTEGVTLHLQLERGSEATSYAPYFTPIELCKLGDYQDYIYEDEGKWYLRKELGKYSLVQGSELGENGIGQEFVSMLTPELPTITEMGHNSGLCRSNMYIPVDSNGTGLSGSTPTGRIRVYTSFKYANTYDGVRAIAQEKGLVIYYPLATATDTEIMNTTLIAQLEALVAGGAENGTTYIKVNATDPNLPGLLYVEAPKYE